MREGYQKSFKKSTGVFPLLRVPFNGQDFEKQKVPGTNNQSLFGRKEMLRKNPILIIYHLGNFDNLRLSGF